MVLNNTKYRDSQLSSILSEFDVGFVQYDKEIGYFINLNFTGTQTS